MRDSNSRIASERFDPGLCVVFSGIRTVMTNGIHKTDTWYCFNQHRPTGSLRRIAFPRFYGTFPGNHGYSSGHRERGVRIPATADNMGRTGAATSSAFRSGPMLSTRFCLWPSCSLPSVFSNLAACYWWCIFRTSKDVRKLRVKNEDLGIKLDIRGTNFINLES